MNALSPFFDVVTESSLRCTFLIGLLLLARPFLRGRAPAYLIFAAWVVIGLRLLIPLAIPARWSPYNATKDWTRAESTQNYAVRSVWGKEPRRVIPSGVTTSSKGEDKTGSKNSGQLSSLFSASSSGNERLTTKKLLAGLWAFGVIGLAVIRIFSVNRFWRKLKQQLQPSEERLVVAVQAVAVELKIKRSPRLVVSGAVSTPAVSGWWLPTLIFPAGFGAGLSSAELRWVILHELGHWMRRDCWAQALLQWGRILHWFNPLVWLCARAARLDCELACDEHVISHEKTHEPADYGAALLGVLEVVSGQSKSASVVGIFESKQQLKKRIHMIAKYRGATVGGVISGTALLLILGLIGATKETSAQSPENSVVKSTDLKGASNSTVPAVTQTVPPGWYVNGSHPKSYLVGLDAAVVHTGAVSSYIKSIEPNIPGFGGMMQNFDAKNYRGKRIRFSAWIKTADVSKSANIWMRIDGFDKRSLKFDNIDNRAPKGTQDWQHFETVLDVPEEAAGIFLGFFVNGTGQAWFNDAKFETVDSSIQETNMPQRPTPAGPQNLSFEAVIPQ